MPTVEKISIALTSDMLSMVRQAVETGDYASTSEVVREALRQWKKGRARVAIGVERAFIPKTEKPVSPTPTSENLAGGLVQTHRLAISQLCRQYQVCRLGLFGSALRTDFDPAQSDLDLAVEFAEPTGRSPARQYFDFKAALEQLLGRRVDLIELAAMPDSRLRRIIERTQVPLYAEAA